MGYTIMYYTVISRNDRFIADGHEEQSNSDGRGKTEL